MTCSYFNFFQFFLHFKLLGQQYYKNESIHLNSWHHSHKKQKDSPETQFVFVDIFVWTWNIWGGLIENTSKQQKMVAFVRNCLANFCCYDYGANALHKETRVVCQLTKTEFYSYTYEKTYLAVYYLLAGDTSKVSIFFLT